MATTFRLPLAPRTMPQLSTTTISLASTKVPAASSLKRSRSPEPRGHSARDFITVKRHRTSTATKAENVDGKERRKIERESQREEFRIKYTKAFPSWTFYFDISDAECSALAPRVLQLNGHITNFFSNEVTHVITNRPIAESGGESNKENTARSKMTGIASLRSPIKLRGLPDEIAASGGNETLIRKAKRFGMKIWDPLKLDSVLLRCCIPAHAPNIATHRPLRTLLESEKRYGTTERDPTQKRHDYHYFSKGSFFVLVEDMRQELATIAALEYPVTRTSDGKEKGTWPVLYCDPLSRGPFIEYNGKEERRREKQERLDREREEERAFEAKRQKLRQLQRKHHDLRRSVSMSNLHREARKSFGPLNGDDLFEFHAPAPAHNDNASGFGSTTTMGSYIAASGNSVSVASTYGTTSTMGAGSSMRSGFGTSALPNGLRGQLQNQIVTSRRVAAERGSTRSASLSKASASSAMMPPPEVPERSRALLRRCKSTNTLRLGKRDEKTKPGYCESCRQKFEDFRMHIRGRRHQKFANNIANFIQLDYALGRVHRQTIAEVEQADQQYSEYVFDDEALTEEEFTEEDEMMHVEDEDADDGNDKENDHPLVPIHIDEDEQYVYLDDDEDDELAQMDEEH
ncbi:Dfp1/Him1, central region-domain-containing protein [Phellopilus nigrolimitatus]|nr:Dfp1/Him1, central region-domain-containing protein [Phellopilus nigrolimitatus]